VRHGMVDTPPPIVSGSARPARTGREPWRSAPVLSRMCNEWRAGPTDGPAA
jgi:hypothetical protein